MKCSNEYRTTAELVAETTTH